MSVQDDARENVMVMMFNLNQAPDRARHDPDAYLDHKGHRFLFELKSTTNKSISTVRDFGPDHIKKWLEMHWIVGFFKSADKKPKYCYYLTPLDMKEWTDQIWEYIKLDFGFADIAAAKISDQDVYDVFGKRNGYSLAEGKRVHKNQYSASQYREKCDIQGGISAQMLARVRCPFVPDDWFDQVIGAKDVYTEADLDRLVDYQASVERITAAAGETRVGSATVSKILPEIVLRRLKEELETGFSIAKAKRHIEWLKTKSAKKLIIDVEPMYSVSAMVDIMRDRCRYLINRGSTLNNPHIPEDFFRKFDKIADEHAKELRDKLTAYLTENPPPDLIGDTESQSDGEGAPA